MLDLSPQHAYKESGNVLEQPDDGVEQPGGAAHGSQQQARPAQRVLHGSSFGGDLAEDQDHQRNHNGGDQFAPGLREAQRQHGSHAGSDDDGDTIDDQDGCEKFVWFSQQALDLDRALIALLGQIFELDATDGGQRRFGSGGHATQDQSYDQYNELQPGFSIKLRK